MKVLVSACLLGERCKYNGSDNYNAKIEEYIQGREVIKVCPEVMGGLQIPRKPAEIVDGVVRTEDGSNVDTEFRRGVEKVLDLIKEEEIEFAILQSRSPSCGVKEIYDGSFSKKKIAGQGLLAQALSERHIRLIDSSEFPLE